jgi:hypothetical protein
MEMITLIQKYKNIYKIYNDTIHMWIIGHAVIVTDIYYDLKTNEHILQIKNSWGKVRWLRFSI